jgi:hypothetical protein
VRHCHQKRQDWVLLVFYYCKSTLGECTSVSTLAWHFPRTNDPVVSLQFYNGYRPQYDWWREDLGFGVWFLVLASAWWRVNYYFTVTESQTCGYGNVTCTGSCMQQCWKNFRNLSAMAQTSGSRGRNFKIWLLCPLRPTKVGERSYRHSDINPLAPEFSFKF